MSFPTCNVAKIGNLLMLCQDFLDPTRWRMGYQATEENISLTWRSNSTVVHWNRQDGRFKLDLGDLPALLRLAPFLYLLLHYSLGAKRDPNDHPPAHPLRWSTSSA